MCAELPAMCLTRAEVQRLYLAAASLRDASLLTALLSAPHHASVCCASVLCAHVGLLILCAQLPYPSHATDDIDSLLQGCCRRATPRCTTLPAAATWPLSVRCWARWCCARRTRTARRYPTRRRRCRSQAAAALRAGPARATRPAPRCLFSGPRARPTRVWRRCWRWRTAAGGARCTAPRGRGRQRRWRRFLPLQARARSGWRAAAAARASRCRR